MYAIIIISEKGITIPFVYEDKKDAENKAKKLQDILIRESVVKVLQTRLMKGD